MSNPIQALSIEGANGEETGRSVETLGHDNYGLFAVADGDPTGVEIRLEGSPDRNHWAALDSRDGTLAEIDGDDFENDPDTDDQTAYAFTRWRNHYIRHIRVRVVSGPTDGTVDVYLLASGNAGGRGSRPTDRKGTPGNA